MNQQEPKFLNSLKKAKTKEIDDAVYKYNLCRLIEREVYAHYKPAIDGKWKLGAIHKEWNKLVKTYRGLNLIAPRDHLKTFFFSEMYALQQCRFRPGIRILILSGSDALAIKKLDNIKTLWAKLPYFEHLLVGADLNNKKQLRFSNGSTIEVAGYNGKVRGGHYDLIIGDDMIDSQVIYSDEFNKKTKERMAMEVLPMAEPDTQIIFIGTIQREGDLYTVDWGSIGSEGDRKWVSKRYDAIVNEEKKITLYPEKWDWDKLMIKKQEIVKLTGSDKWFLKEYRNMKINLLGEIVKQDWIRGYDVMPLGDYTNYWGWDLSVGKDPDSGDYTVGVHFFRDDKGNIFIDKIIRKRIGFSERLQEITINAKLTPEVLRIAVEQNAFQYDSVQTLITNTSLPIEGVQTNKNKIIKFNEMLPPMFANGKVFIKNGIENRQEFVDELVSLPRGQHDDIADAFCIGIKGLASVGEPNLTFIDFGGGQDDDGDF